MKNALKCVLMVAVGLVGLVGCRTSDSADVQSAVAQTSMASSGGMAMNTITDAQAGAVAHTIDDGEIQMAQVALTNASSPAVRDFAQMMITDHQNANAMLERNGYMAAPNPITETLNAKVNTTMSQLRGMTGSAFDRAYIASQIDMHTTALDTFRTTLIPSAHEPNLKQTLTTMRDTVQMHLQHARDLQTTMGR